MDNLIIKEMCEGCARIFGNTCKIIKDPLYFYEKHGECFAKVGRERAQEIEWEITGCKKKGA